MHYVPFSGRRSQTSLPGLGLPIFLLIDATLQKMRASKYGRIHNLPLAQCTLIAADLTHALGIILLKSPERPLSRSLALCNPKKTSPPWLLRHQELRLLGMECDMRGVL